MKPRPFLLSDSKEIRSALNAELMSKADIHTLTASMSAYACLEPTLEGEITALLAAACDEQGTYPPGNRTLLLMGRIGLITGSPLTYGDLARKFDVSPTTARKLARSGLQTLAQASLARVLPVMPRLDALHSMLQLDPTASLLKEGSTLPGLICHEGRLPIPLAVLFGWDVLRWKLPIRYRKRFLNTDLLPAPQSNFTFSTKANGTVSSPDRAVASDPDGVSLTP